jgi:hypothetical protein
MQDFILALVAVFILFKVLESFRGSRRKDDNDNDRRGGQGNRGSQTYSKGNSDYAEDVDYEIIEEKLNDDKKE